MSQLTLIDYTRRQRRPSTKGWTVTDVPSGLTVPAPASVVPVQPKASDDRRNWLETTVVEGVHFLCPGPKRLPAPDSAERFTVSHPIPVGGKWQVDMKVNCLHHYMDKAYVKDYYGRFLAQYYSTESEFSDSKWEKYY